MAHVRVIDVAPYEPAHRATRDHIRSEVFLGRDSRRLMASAGFCEYYDPITGEGLGGGAFSWAAAAGLAWALA